MRRAVVIVSGGLDSVVMAHLLSSQKYSLQILSFNYGQRHKKELQFAATAATELGAEHQIINLSDVQKLFTGSSLTDDSKEVPEGHYSEASMAQTVVPNRNAIMLSIAWGVAVAQQAEVVAYGAHLGDHAQYPDCRQEFIDSFVKALHLGNLGFEVPTLHLYTPFSKVTKADIVKAGKALGVEFQKTWSCYKGGEVHCGRCGTCVERAEAFHLAGVADPTVYEDAEYWKTAVKEFASK